MGDRLGTLGAVGNLFFLPFPPKNTYFFAEADQKIITTFYVKFLTTPPIKITYFC